jgi:signal transduction histidine kinase
VANEVTWNSDPDAERRRFGLRDDLLACFQESLGHELSNRFLAIQYNAGEVDRKARDRLDDKGRGELDRLVALVRRGGELVRALADLGRLCRDPGPVVAVALAETVLETATRVKVLYPQRIIRYDLQDTMPTVRAPWRPLDLALFHLLRNAAEAVQPGAAAEIAVRAEATPQAVALHVADNGRGMAEGDLKRLLKPYPRGADTEGLGLGLFVVRQAVALWGGGVRVRSEPGRGSTFTLLFPAP